MRLFLILTLGLLTISFACGQTDSEIPAVVQPTLLPVEIRAQANTVTDIQDNQDYGAEPTLTPDVHASLPYTEFYGAATASLEERILYSDVVVRARLLNASNGELNFRALEYLKGTGPTDFSLTGDAENQQANSEAVLFLKQANPITGGVTGAPGVSGVSGTSGGGFRFADTTGITYGPFDQYDASYRGHLPSGNTPGSNNPVWLPRTAVSGGVTGATGDTVEYLLDVGNESVALSELRERIAWVQGDGSPEYVWCVTGVLEHERYIRDWSEYHQEPWQVGQEETEIVSGQTQGTAFYVFEDLFDKPEREDVWLSGPDADLFNVEVTDYDNDPSTLAGIVFSTLRPLPAGIYTVIGHLQFTSYKRICNGVQLRNRLQWTVTVTAPPRTFHEAFFDPATTTTGVGFSADPAVGVGFSVDPTVGVLEPTRLAATTSREIEGLEWADGEVRLTLSPFGALAHRQFEFLNLDADVILTLPTHIAVKDRAARTLTWDVPSQPWTSGDQLMLRVVPIPLPETHPTLRLVLTFGFGNAGVAFRWDALSDVDGSPVTGYSIEWSLSPYGPWAVVDSSGGGIRCVANMSFEPDEATQCQLTYIAAGLTGGQPYHFRLIAHSDNGDSLPSPSLDLRTR